jgi:hypothetical protein
MARAVPILCLLAVALAGCGSASTTSQFESGYAAARAPLDRTFADVTKAIAEARTTSSAELSRSIGDLATRFAQDLAPLEALTPPPAVATAFTTLTSSLKRITADLRGISGTAKRRDLGGAQLALESLASDERAASLAATAIKQKLYTN